MRGGISDKCGYLRWYEWIYSIVFIHNLITYSGDTGRPAGKDAEWFVPVNTPELPPSNPQKGCRYSVLYHWASPSCCHVLQHETCGNSLNHWFANFFLHQLSGQVLFLHLFRWLWIKESIDSHNRQITGMLKSFVIKRFFLDFVTLIHGFHGAQNPATIW